MGNAFACMHLEISIGRDIGLLENLFTASRSFTGSTSCSVIIVHYQNLNSQPPNNKADDVVSIQLAEV